MHADDMEDVIEARGGDIVAMFGVDCASGDTFTDGSVNYTMTSMNVPEPVMSLAIIPATREGSANVSLVWVLNLRCDLDWVSFRGVFLGFPCRGVRLVSML